MRVRQLVLSKLMGMLMLNVRHRRLVQEEWACRQYPMSEYMDGDHRA